MRILVLTNLFPTERAPWGGGFVLSRVEALRSAGHDVDCRAIVPRRTKVARWVAGSLLGGDPRGHGALHSLQFPAVYVPMDGLQALMMARGVCPQRLVEKAAARLAAAVDLNSYDFVIAHGMYGVPAGSVAKAAVGDDKYAVVCHGSDINLLMPSNRRLYKAALDGARTSVFVSSALAARARSLGMESESVAVVPNGVDLARFNPDRRSAARGRLGLGAEDPVVAFVGNLAKVKGADRLPSLVTELAKLKSPVHWLIAGDGPLRGAIEEDLGPSNRMLGRLDQEQVADLMAASDVLVLPSRSEGWPTVIREAHASGTSVVGSDVGGIPEALATTGRIIPEGPDFAYTFASAVRDALEDDEHVRRGLRTSAEGGSWDAVVRDELGAIFGGARW